MGNTIESAIGTQREAYRYSRANLTQSLICGDLEQPDTIRRLSAVLPDTVRLVYSDPPWNPGNATYWRTHAGKEPCSSYSGFLSAWCAAVVACIDRGAEDVFTEQSANEKHCQMLLNVIEKTPGWTLPLLEKWTVFYGTPGSAGCRLPNVLLHFGTRRLRTDPSNMAGEPMTIRVCAGIGAPPGSWVVDPCIGKGMTSRMAHYFGWNCAGTELNTKRLSVTRQWLIKQGYSEKRIDG